jgi:hypothetical protein
MGADGGVRLGGRCFNRRNAKGRLLMANIRDRGARWLENLAAALILASIAGHAGRADEAGVPPRRNEREVLEALRDLRAAVQRDARAAGRSGAVAAAKLPKRPARTITPPTIDAAAVDDLLAKGLKAAKTPAAPLTTDEEFVRRVFLDVTGKLPAPDQVRGFVRSKDPEKRAKLIDALLSSPDHARNWARYWRDVIRFHATNPNPRLVGYAELETWLTEQWARNRPWDEIAQELITATGRNDQNGAVGFALAQQAQPVELAGEVARVFLGVQIQCAQCHDHPTDAWKRRQFHEFASFFAGLRARRAPGQGPSQAPPVFEVVAQGRPSYTMPDLKDPQKPVPVAPRFFLASASETIAGDLPSAQRRALAAAYITGQDNPWFAKSFVNRIWAALMGEGFYNPVDDLGPTRTANAPEVIDLLASQWRNGGYDVRWLFRTILNTRTYQRAVRATNSASGRTPFAASCPSRLRADQLLDALAQALGLPLDGTAVAERAPGKGKSPGKGQGQGSQPVQARGTAGPNAPPVRAGKQAGANPAPPRRDLRNQFSTLFGIDPSTPAEEVLGTIPQALFLMNSPPINRAIQARPGTLLGEVLARAPNDRAALEAIYLRVLARRPNAKEIQTCGRYLDLVGDRREAFEDVLWCLINSTEFLTRR